MRLSWLLCLLCSVSFVFAAANVTVTTQEAGKITNYFNQYWVVNVDGTISVNNPTVRDLYDVAIRYDILGLSIVETGGTTYFRGNQMLINRIPANSTVSASYNIVGITLQDPALTDAGVLYTGMTQFAPVIYSDAFGQLQKANLENETLTGRPGRLISVELSNPTGFQFTVNSLRVLKTLELDPNDIVDEWVLVNDSSPLVIDPDNLFVRDFLDYDSAEGEVYWLVADVFISRVVFLDNSNITRYTEVNLTLPPEFLNYTLNVTNLSNRTLPSVNELYVKKLADQQIVLLGKPVTLSFVVNNFAPQLASFTILDTLPPGFSFQPSSGWSEQAGKIMYTGQISGKSAVVVSYQALLTDGEAAGLDYFDSARLDYTLATASKTIYSDTVPFIRQFLPSQKLYMQKKLRFADDDQVTITLILQNLGSSFVSDLLIKEYLGDADVFSQITQQPEEKGLWSVPSLGPGETWEVTYLTTQDTQVNILPGVFGVPSKDVLKSIVLETVISAGWEAVKTAALELVGIVLILCFPIAYYVMRKQG